MSTVVGGIGQGEHTVTYDDAAHLILGHRPVHDERKRQQNPGQIRRFKHEQPQEAEHRVWIFATPDIDQRARKRGAEKGHGEHGCYTEKKCRSEGEEP